MYACFYVCKLVLIFKNLTLRDSAILHFNITGIRSIWVELQLWECSIFKHFPILSYLREINMTFLAFNLHKVAKLIFVE